jgi:rhodanese-related sulfurtransferase
MQGRWRRLSPSQKLGVIALGLGVVALFAQPSRGNVVTVDLDELAELIDSERDHVTVEEVAAWIVEGRADYRLIDLRSEAEYATYHIPTAENVTLSSLPEASLQPAEKIVLYSEGGIHGAQAWMLLRGKGYANTYTLQGGLDEWKEAVLFPALPANAGSPDRERFERAAARARFFGGSPRTGAGGAATALPELPKVVAPMAPAGTAPKLGRKKKEGC